jgi:putative peptidoglycan binding protein
VGGDVVTFTPTAEQIGNATVVRAAIYSAGGTSRDVLAALMTILVESDARNVEYGDRDSLGLFQQRSRWWGSAAQRLDPIRAAQAFYGALTRIPNRDQDSLGELCQTVQGSAYPDRYAQRQGDAGTLLAALPPMRAAWSRPVLSVSHLLSSKRLPNSEDYWDEVLVLQRALAAAGFPCPPTGYYTSTTTSAVMAAQKAAGSTVPDGWFGPLELDWLRRKVAGKVDFTTTA